VLHELDNALRALLDGEIGGDADVEIEFDAPTKDWATRRNRPTIDVYLYDIRQELSRSQFGQVPVRDEEGYIAEHRPLPKYFRLSYLVTAWTQRPEDEHRLLSALMATFLRNSIVPPALLNGSLAELGISIPMAIALPTPQDRSLSDVWTALGGELKPSLDLTIIAPLLPERVQEAGPPVLEEPVLDVRRARDATELERVGGRPVPPERRTAPVDLRPPPVHVPDRRRRRK
jgi:uncharacterized protein DUF4255